MTAKLKVGLKMKIAALVIFILFVCNSGTGYPLVDCGIRVFPLEAKSKIVTDAVGQQEKVPIPAQQLQSAEVEFVL